jgi:ribosomal protein S8
MKFVKEVLMLEIRQFIVIGDFSNETAGNKSLDKIVEILKKHGYARKPDKSDFYVIYDNGDIFVGILSKVSPESGKGYHLKFDVAVIKANPVIEKKESKRDPNLRNSYEKMPKIPLFKNPDGSLGCYKYYITI